MAEQHRSALGCPDELAEGAVPGHAPSPRDELVERVGRRPHHAHEYGVGEQPLLRRDPLVERCRPEHASRRGVPPEADGQAEAVQREQVRPEQRRR